MPRSQKQKTSVKKKKASVGGSVDDDVLAALERLDSESSGDSKRSRAKSKTAKSKAKRGPSRSKTSQVPVRKSIESEIALEDLMDVTEERTSIISIVKGLEGQVETAFKLKEVLESELEATQKRLSEELEVRAQHEAQIESLKAQAALAEQLRQDVGFAEEERNKFADLLGETQPKLEQVIAEHDSLVEQLNASEVCAKKIEGEKMALEAQVMNLKDRIVDIEQMRDELSEMTKTNRRSHEQVHELTRRLETSEASNNALERELTGAHKNVKTLQKEVEELREKVIDAESQSADLRIQIGELMEGKAQLENEIKMTNINYEAAKSELDAFKNALRDIRSEATRTSGRVRQRYFYTGNGRSRSKSAKSSTSR